MLTPTPTRTYAQATADLVRQLGPERVAALVAAMERQLRTPPPPHPPDAAAAAEPAAADSGENINGPDSGGGSGGGSAPPGTHGSMAATVAVVGGGASPDAGGGGGKAPPLAHDAPAVAGAVADGAGGAGGGGAGGSSSSINGDGSGGGGLTAALVATMGAGLVGSLVCCMGPELTSGLVAAMGPALTGQLVREFGPDLTAGACARGCGAGRGIAGYAGPGPRGVCSRGRAGGTRYGVPHGGARIFHLRCVASFPKSAEGGAKFWFGGRASTGRRRLGADPTVSYTRSIRGAGNRGVLALSAGNEFPHPLLGPVPFGGVAGGGGGPSRVGRAIQSMLHPA